MSRTKAYLSNLDIAVQLFKDGHTPLQISKMLNMDIGCLRNNLREHGYVNLNYDTQINHNIFNNIDNEEKAYWIGFLYADGYVSKSCNRIELCIKDKEHVLKFEKFLNLSNRMVEKIVKINNKSLTYYKLSFRNKQIHSDLIKLCCIPCKSLQLQFPTKDIVPKEFIHHFVRGYFDGDGSVHKYDYENSLFFSIIGTLCFLKSIQDLYGLPNNKLTKLGKAYEYKCGAKQHVFNFFDAIYNNCTICLERKYETYLRCRFK